MLLTLTYDADVASISAQLAFAGYAIHYARRSQAAGAEAANAPDAAEDFVKARGTQGRWYDL